MTLEKFDAVGHSGDALDRPASDGRGQQHCLEANDVRRLNVRPQIDRRQRGRLLPEADQGRGGRPPPAPPRLIEKARSALRWLFNSLLFCQINLNGTVYFFSLIPCCAFYFFNLRLVADN